MPASRFGPALVRAIGQANLVRIRAGTADHRFIGIWAVVVDGRVFVRSWSLKPRSWWRTFLDDPTGAIEIAGEAIPVRARQATSERLRDAIDEAYLRKYDSPGSIKYARDLGSGQSRETTTELMPLSRASLAPSRARPARAPAARHQTGVRRGSRTRRS